MTFEKKRRLSIEEILEWADSHYERTGRWPISRHAVPVWEAPGEDWLNIDHSLRRGCRGLPAGLSLSRLLDRCRGRRSSGGFPPCQAQTILAWADAYHERTGEWPRSDSGTIPDGGGETWAGVDATLDPGCQELPIGSRLAQLLVQHRFASRQESRHPLSESQILEWAGAYFRRTGKWPRVHSGAVEDAPGETWLSLHQCLCLGLRGLRKGGSLPQLLRRERRSGNHRKMQKLELNQILEWADAYHARSGRWPDGKSGTIPESPGDRWSAVAAALYSGGRGLPKGLSIARLLAEHRGVRRFGPHKFMNLPLLSEESILAWADAYRRQTGDWPRLNSGLISDADGQTWSMVNTALLRGYRGLPGGLSLSRLLLERRGAGSSRNSPLLSECQILDWADAHFQRTGKWPRINSGPIEDAPGETWQRIGHALCEGFRGLTKGGSIPRLLERERGARNPMTLPKLRVDQILEWADAYYARTGAWPTPKSGSILEAPEETWSKVNSALCGGTRGFRGFSSLARLLRERPGSPPDAAGDSSNAETRPPAQML